MKYTIDRFEGNYAICEKDDRTMIDIQRDKLPPTSKEGDIIIFENGTYRIDIYSTNNRKEHIKKLMDDLWE